MKTTYVLLGLAVATALVAAPASAHVILGQEGEDGCEYTSVGDPRFGPHAYAWTGDCQVYHTGPILP